MCVLCVRVFGAFIFGFSIGTYCTSSFERRIQRPCTPCTPINSYAYMLETGSSSRADMLSTVLTMQMQIVVFCPQSKRLSKAEFLAFASSLVWQSATLAKTFQDHQTVLRKGGHVTSAAPDPQDLKRQRYNMPGNTDITSTVHALMALSNTQFQVVQWGAPSQLPSVQQLLAQGRPDVPHASIDSAARGLAARSTSSTPSPLINALQPMYAPADIAQALASLSQAHQTHKHLSDLVDLCDASRPTKFKTDAPSVCTTTKDTGSSACSSPSTPPAHPKERTEKPSKPTLRVGSGGGAQLHQLQGAGMGGGGVASTLQSEDGSAHNKYCHFCQHIKVKRASSMIACENRGCNRRFCEHCLNTHIADQVATSFISLQ